MSLSSSTSSSANNPIQPQRPSATTKYEGVIEFGGRQFQWIYDTGKAFSGDHPPIDGGSINDRVQQLFTQFVSDNKLEGSLAKPQPLNIHSIQGIGHLEGDSFTTIKKPDAELAQKISAFLTSIEGELQSLNQEQILPQERLASTSSKRHLPPTPPSSHEQHSISDLQAQNRELLESMQQTHRRLDHLQEESRAQERHYHEQLSRFQTEISLQREENIHLRHTRDQRQMAHDYETQIFRGREGELIRENKRLQSTIEEMESKLDRVTSKLTKQKQNLKVSKKIIKEKQKEINKLQRRLFFSVARNKEIPVLKAQITREQRKLEAFQNRISTLEATIESGQKTFGELTATLKETKASEEQLRIRLEHKDRENQRLQEQLRGYESEVYKLKGVIAGMESTHQLELEPLRSELRHVNEKLGSTKIELGALKEEKETLQGVLAITAETLSKQQSSNHELATQKSVLEERLRHQNERIERLESLERTLQQKNQTLNDTLEKKQRLFVKRLILQVKNWYKHFQSEKICKVLVLA